MNAWECRLILLRNNEIFYNALLRYLFVLKKSSVKKFLAVTQHTQELLRLSSNGLVNRSFFQLDIWRIQLKSNWTVGEFLIASSYKTVCKIRLIFWKSRLIFLMLCLQINSFWKNCLGRNLLMMYVAHRELLRLSNQTVGKKLAVSDQWQFESAG